MRKRATLYGIFHLGSFVLGGLGFAMSVPQWVFFTLAAFWLILVGWTLADCRPEMSQFICKLTNGKFGRPKMPNHVGPDKLISIETHDEAFKRQFNSLIRPAIFGANVKVKRMARYERPGGEVYEKPFRSVEDDD